MIFYVSGELTDNILDFVIEHRLPMLSSFAYKSWRFRCERIAAKLRGTNTPKILHMLDSGAFSAWSKGAQIRLPALLDTAKMLQDKYSDVIDWTFVALDKIPGEPGKPITVEEASTACKISADNYCMMRDELKGYVMPVFHTGDPEWLSKTYAGAAYIGLGMSQALSEKGRVKSAQDSCRLFNGKRLHGLAATGSRMLRITRWHSVDSAAWLLWGAYGGIGIVKHDGQIVNLAISKDSRLLKHDGKHYTTLTPIERQWILGRIERRGFNVAQLAESYESRSLFNLQQFDEACQIADKLSLLYETGDLYA